MDLKMNDYFFFLEKNNHEKYQKSIHMNNIFMNLNNQYIVQRIFLYLLFYCFVCLLFALLYVFQNRKHYLKENISRIDQLRKMQEAYYLWNLPSSVKQKLEELYTKKESVEEEGSREMEDTTITPCLSCLLCNVSFETRQEQLDHYTSESHVENVRKRCQMNEDSDSEDSSDTEGNEWIENEKWSLSIDGKVLSIYKRLIENGLYSKECVPSSILSLLNASVAVFLYRSGYFVACIFKNVQLISEDQTAVQGVCIRHKSERRYTTRRKQGGSQSKKDKTTGMNSMLYSDLQERQNQWVPNCEDIMSC